MNKFALMMAVSLILSACGKHDGLTTTPPTPKAASRPSGPKSFSKQSLQQAFQAAFGVSSGAKTAEVKQDDDTLTFKPRKLVPVGDLVVLISDGKIEDGAVAQSGQTLVDYLRATQSGFQLVKRWPDIGGGAQNGEAPDWTVRKDLFEGPAIQIETTSLNQGCGNVSANLVELTQNGPVVRATDVPLNYSNSASDDESADIDGQIDPGIPGQSFRVVYTKPVGVVAVYARHGATYTPVDPAKLPQGGC